MSIGSGPGHPEAAIRFGRKTGLNNTEGATTKTARDINRRIVLNLIRKFQPVSRADLARYSGLQRSTVSAIAEQLIAERWVTMGATGDVPRGRKPTFLHLNGDRAAILGVDVRPTETIIAVADLNMRFLSQETMPTSRDPDQFTRELCKRICQTIKCYPRLAFEGIGVALPGRVDPVSGRLTFAPNLAWKPIDLRTPLEQASGLSVQLENAANACALVEISSGRYSEHVRNLIAITISEGVGTGMILNGQLVRGVGGLAGEFGHVTIQEDGVLCSCGNKGCLEACGSNTAAVRYFSELTSGGKSSKCAPLDFSSILRLAEQGDARACEALDRMARCLGVGTAILVAGLSPDVIVLVGEVTDAWERIGPTINEAVKRRVVAGSHTQIVPTDSRTQPRLRGAIALVLQQHFGATDLMIDFPKNQPVNTEEICSKIEPFHSAKTEATKHSVCNGMGNGEMRVSRPEDLGRTQLKGIQKIEASVNYMMQHLSEPMTVPVLSALVGLSASSFHPLFKRATGRTPLDFLIQARMSRACELLEGTGLNVKEIAASVGYNDPFYFSRLFKSVNGVPPREYREIKVGDRIREVSKMSSTFPTRNPNDSNWIGKRSLVSG